MDQHNATLLLLGIPVRPGKSLPSLGPLNVLRTEGGAQACGTISLKEKKKKKKVREQGCRWGTERLVHSQWRSKAKACTRWVGDGGSNVHMMRMWGWWGGGGCPPCDGDQVLVVAHSWGYAEPLVPPWGENPGIDASHAGGVWI